MVALPLGYDKEFYPRPKSMDFMICIFVGLLLNIPSEPIVTVFQGFSVLAHDPGEG
jgi:hypothetical protein